MKVLAIVASGRKMGNSEILAKHILDQCRSQGAQVTLLRLADWNFQECQGCFGCLFTEKPCRVKDDVEKFASRLFTYDRILVCSPTYLLFPPGVVKMLIDRVGIFVTKAQKQSRHPQFCAAVGVAGIEGWDYFTMPMLTMFLKVITGYKAEIVDQVLFHHPGPGEVLLSEQTMQRAGLVAKNLVQGEIGKEQLGVTSEAVCPVCCSNGFIIKPGAVFKLECPICLTRGTIEEKNGNGVCWDSSSIRSHRFTEEAGRKFVDTWIIKTRQPFLLENLKEIMVSKKEYKDTQIGIDWERP